MVRSSTSLNKRKNKNFIYDAYHNMKGKLKGFIEKLKITTKSQLEAEDDPTLYQMFLDWLLEITQYGIMLTIFVNMFIGFQGIHNLYNWFVFGLLRWFIIDLIEKIRQLTR